MGESTSITSSGSARIIERKYAVPFVLVASLFPLWGFANDVTNPLVRAFKDIFLISNAESSLVQFAFYLGYGVMAIPAAVFIRIYSYKSGILLGLGLYAVGASLFVPASIFAQFYFFLVALCVLTCGLALLETTANPYILSMGNKDTATRRLNLAQAFNPVGSLTGMFVASTVILNRLQVEEFRSAQRAVHPDYERMLPVEVDQRLTESLEAFAASDPVAYQTMQAADLVTVRGPYIAIAVVVAILFMVFLVSRLPRTVADSGPTTALELRATMACLVKNRRYREGVVAQAFYVGAQIMCWTFIIHYGMVSLGMSAAEAQRYNIVAMMVFLTSRFVCTFLLAYVRPGQLLMLTALGGVMLSLGTAFGHGMVGLYCLVGISACMSLMFPTIYGIALHGLNEDATLGSAGLIMAIVGGALMPPLQGVMIDAGPLIADIPSVKTSFFLPLLCFLVVAAYGYRAHYVHRA